MNNIVLIGFSQSGKTTVGKLLAEKTQQSFIELEEELQQEYQKSVDELLEKFGPEEFRDIEKSQIEKYMSRKNKIIAIRSNSIADEEMAELLPKIGTVVYLHTDRDELCRRMEIGQSDPMPDQKEFDEDSFCRYIESKEPLFFKVSGIIIQTADKSPEDICEEIIMLI